MADPKELKYVPVEEGPEEPIEVAPIPTIRNLCINAGILEDGQPAVNSINPDAINSLPEAGGIVFADLIPEIDDNGQLSMALGRISITARDVLATNALNHFLLTLANLEEIGVAIKFQNAPKQMVKRPESDAPAPNQMGKAKVSQPTLAPKAPAPQAENFLGPTAEGVYMTTITKVTINPLAGEKVELALFEKKGYQYPFLKTFPLTRQEALKHLNDAGVDGEAMLKVVKDAPQSFSSESGIGLAWREGKPMVKNPEKHYKNFVGLFDLAVGWV